MFKLTVILGLIGCALSVPQFYQNDFFRGFPGNDYAYQPVASYGGRPDATPIMEDGTEAPVRFPPATNSIQLDRVRAPAPPMPAQQVGVQQQQPQLFPDVGQYGAGQRNGPTSFQVFNGQF